MNQTSRIRQIIRHQNDPRTTRQRSRAGRRGRWRVHLPATAGKYILRFMAVNLMKCRKIRRFGMLFSVRLSMHFHRDNPQIWHDFIWSTFQFGRINGKIRTRPQGENKKGSKRVNASSPNFDLRGLPCLTTTVAIAIQPKDSQ